MWRKTVINLAGKKSSYLPKETPSDVKDLLSYYLPVLHYVDDLHPIPDDDFFKVTLLVPKDLTVTIQSEINTLFADYQLTATSSGFGCIDVIPSHVHKGTGIDFLLDYWGYGPENLMVFGDGGNDVAMLQYVGLGVAMGNATEPLKNAADN